MTTTPSLSEILASMDIPASRREISRPNVRWLMRNIQVRNSDHPDIDLAIRHLRDWSKAASRLVMQPKSQD